MSLSLRLSCGVLCADGDGRMSVSSRTDVSFLNSDLTDVLHVLLPFTRFSRLSISSNSVARFGTNFCKQVKCHREIKSATSVKLICHLGHYNASNVLHGVSCLGFCPWLGTRPPALESAEPPPALQHPPLALVPLWLQLLQPFCAAPVQQIHNLGGNFFTIIG